MRTALKPLVILCAGALLLACAQTGQRPAPVKVAAASDADAAYQQARSAHLAGRHAEALSAYQSTLLADPGHVNAGNGLATLHAEQGDFERAIPMWRALTATAAGPESAYLLVNLGHAHAMQGEYDKALPLFERAVLLDPLRPRAWQRLGGALEKLGQHERAQLMFKQADALQAHDLKADYAATERPAVPAIEKALQANAVRSGEWGATEVRQDASGMLELHRVPALPAPPRPAAPAPMPALPAPLKVKALLEIRNGNGVAGMARSLSRKMDPDSVRVVRLSNQKGFQVRQTRVEFQPPFRAAALQLAGRFGQVKVVEGGKGNAPDMRLVLGRDLARSKIALRPLTHAAPATFVQHQTRSKGARDNETDSSSTPGAQP